MTAIDMARSLRSVGFFLRRLNFLNGNLGRGRLRRARRFGALNFTSRVTRFPVGATPGSGGGLCKVPPGRPAHSEAIASGGRGAHYGRRDFSISYRDPPPIWRAVLRSRLFAIGARSLAIRGL